ncbi:DUF1566 domain-containing protein [Sulfurospirillum oryzae]|uniref:Lcl C-terminal domain-containing protein n=1 Tax=Sulfurospirillum oryzae TaxID=2976535 RepID=UPI0021E79EC7|nr:DUF1566 domain-containing protein [Sulfurospirillum oryzae]
MKKLIFIFTTLLITTEMFAEFSRDNEKQIVTDSTSGLIWQDDNVTKIAKMNLSDAKNSCEALKLGGYNDWRVPSIEELQTITDYSRFNPAIQKEFVNFSFDDYWSSTIYANSMESAHIVRTQNGSLWGSAIVSKRHFRCVRGGTFGTFNSFAEYKRSGFTRDDNQKIVTDTKTNLQWQDDEAVKFTKNKWLDANRYCRALRLGGYDNWRLPRIEELYSIKDYNKVIPAINDAFVNLTSDRYWSSTISANNNDKFWFIENYSTNNSTQSRTNFVHCVRDNTMNSSSLEIDSILTIENKEDNYNRIKEKEIKHFNHPAVCDFIMAREIEPTSVTETDPNYKWRYVKEIAKNKSLYISGQQNTEVDFSVVLVKNGNALDWESIKIENNDNAGADKKNLLTRLGIKPDETASKISLQCNNKHLKLFFQADTLKLIEITKEQK